MSDEDYAWSGTVHPETGCRLPPVDRSSLDERGRRVVERQLDPARGSLVGMRGPLAARIHSPAIAEHGQRIIDFFRNDSILDARTQEVAILITARTHNSNFEWAAHAPAARKAGVTAAVIEAIRTDGPLDALPERDALIVQIGRHLFRDHKLPGDVYAAAMQAFGRRGLVELVTLMGNYAGTAALLAAFDMQLPDGAEPELS